MINPPTTSYRPATSQPPSRASSALEPADHPTRQAIIGNTPRLVRAIAPAQVRWNTFTAATVMGFAGMITATGLCVESEQDFPNPAWLSVMWSAPVGVVIGRIGFRVMSFLWHRAALATEAQEAPAAAFNPSRALEEAMNEWRQKRLNAEGVAELAARIHKLAVDSAPHDPSAELNRQAVEALCNLITYEIADIHCGTSIEAIAKTLGAMVIEGRCSMRMAKQTFGNAMFSRAMTSNTVRLVANIEYFSECIGPKKPKKAKQMARSRYLDTQHTVRQCITSVAFPKLQHAPAAASNPSRTLQEAMNGWRQERLNAEGVADVAASIHSFAVHSVAASDSPTELNDLAVEALCNLITDGTAAADCDGSIEAIAKTLGLMVTEGRCDMATAQERFRDAMLSACWTTDSIQLEGLRKRCARLIRSPNMAVSDHLDTKHTVHRAITSDAPPKVNSSVSVTIRQEDNTGSPTEDDFRRQSTVAQAQPGVLNPGPAPFVASLFGVIEHAPTAAV